MPQTLKAQLALVDDHTLFRKGLISLIEMVSDNYSILFEADNGKDLQQKINKENQPDIILMDINMPDMDGIESVRWLNVVRASSLIRSVARVAASMSTPESAYEIDFVIFVRLLLCAASAVDQSRRKR